MARCYPVQGGDGDLFLTLEFEPMPSESIPDAMDGGSTEASTEAFSIHEPHQDETQEKEEEQEEADDTAGRLARALRAHGLPLSVSRLIAGIKLCRLPRATRTPL